MNKIIKVALVFSLPMAVLALWSWKGFDRPAPTGYPRPVNVPVSMCGTVPFNWNDTLTVRAVLLPGLGDLHYPVTTVSLKAQEFFEQGLRLVYAFNHWEAIQAFREAARLDPDFAMAYWGLALAYGPNLNDVNPQDRERIAFESIQKAIDRKGRVSQVEKDMIDAMAARYNGKVYENRDSLNQTYATAMTQLAKKYPADAEVLTLCADAIMNTMPWDYWEKDGAPKPATAEAKVLLENTMKLFPKHPGAHHLYIHLVEASSAPEQGLPSAQFLEKAMPGAGHIVHMPAHIYLRTGQYGRAVELNQQAAKVDETYLASSTNYGMYRLAYYPHNVDFIGFGSYMEGRSALGIQTAMKLAYKGSTVKSATPTLAQYFIAEPIIAFVRFGKWEEILSLPQPDGDLTYAQAIFRFGRGLAYLRLGNEALANREMEKLDSLAASEALKSFYFSFNPASEIVKIPQRVLRAELLLKQNQPDAGLAALRDAIKAEEEIRYNEPPDWKIPSRHFLGAALLDQNRFVDAEQVYLEDLKKNPENGWALIGLQQCYSKQGKKSEMTNTAKRYTKAWKNADVALTSSRY